MQSCSICELDTKTVGDLKIVHASVEKNGRISKVSQFVCSHCERFIDKIEETPES